MTCDWSVFLSPNTFSAILFPPEDKQTQDEKLSKTEKTSASYSSELCKKDTRNRRGYWEKFNCRDFSGKIQIIEINVYT